MPDNWDPACENIFRDARTQCEALQHTWLGTEHLGLAMLSRRGSFLCRQLESMRINPDQVANMLLHDLEGIEAPSAAMGLPLTPRISNIVAVADALAAAQACHEIEETHLVQAVLQGGPGVLVRCLQKLRIDPKELLSPSPRPIVVKSLDTVRTALADSEPRKSMSKSQKRKAPRPESDVLAPRPPLGPMRMPPVSLQRNPVLVDFGIVRPPSPRSSAPLLESMGRNLTELARTHPVTLIGRDVELDSLMVALCRRGRTRTLLVGAPGTGKTALIEALAARITNGQAYADLAGHRVIELSSALLVSEGEALFLQVMEEAARKPTILVLDEFHRLFGPDPTWQANIVRPLLNRPDVTICGTTLPEPFSALIQDDVSLARRLTVIRVEETTSETTQAILEDARTRLEAFHHVQISSGAVKAAYRLARSRIPERAMPDVALQILDEACVWGRHSGGQVTEEQVGQAVDRQCGKA